MLQRVKTAMLAAQQDGSLAGEHGINLQARIWLAAFQAMPAIAGPPGPPGPQGPPGPTAEVAPDDGGHDPNDLAKITTKGVKK